MKSQSEVQKIPQILGEEVDLTEDMLSDELIPPAPQILEESIGSVQEKPVEVHPELEIQP